MDENGESPVVESDTEKERDVDYGWVENRTYSKQWLEYVLLNIVFIAYQVDNQLLQTFGHQLQVAFKVSQSQLGMMSTVKGWTSMCVGIPTAFITERVPRTQLLCVGCLIWGAGLVVCGIAWTWPLILVGRLINGVGLGMVKPLCFSLVADKNPPSSRGMAFGVMSFASNLGITLIIPLCISVSDADIHGMEGWRWCCIVIGVVSGLIGLAVWRLVDEPTKMEVPEGSVWSGFVENMPKVVQLFKYPTFVLLCAQGGPGTMPWTLVGSFPQWLQLLCFTNPQSAFINSGFNLGNTFCPLIAGALLTLAVRKCPNHGPPSIANFATGVSVPLSMIIFLLLPKPDFYNGAAKGTVDLYTFVLFVTGLVVGMCGAVNATVFSLIVPSSLYTYAYAWDTALEGAIGNMAPIAVGIISDKVFHLDKEAAQSEDCDQSTGVALGNSMLTVFSVGWGICFLIYLGMQITYPIDRKRALAEQAALRLQEREVSGGDSEETESGSGSSAELE